MNRLYVFERIVSEFARLTGKDRTSATKQIEDILDYLLFNHPDKTAPESEDHFRLSGTYERLAEYNGQNVNEDEQLARYFRIAASIGSHVVANGMWVQLQQQKAAEGRDMQEIVTKVLAEYLSRAPSN